MATINLRTPNGYDGQLGTTHKFGIVRFATTAEATAGTATNAALSPATGVLSVPDATTTVKGKVALATNAESVTGTNTTKAVTPDDLTARLAAPGTIGGTTPGAATFSNLTATGTVHLNTSGAGTTVIGTGGTGATQIGNATGNTAVTGSLTASTSLTATLGNITATNGNLVLTAAGNKMVRTSVGSGAAAGANSIGTATLVGGTITISTTSLGASSLVRVWRESIGATGAAATGNLVVGTRTAGVSFVINAVSAADATALAATDVSVVGWEIIN